MSVVSELAGLVWVEDGKERAGFLHPQEIPFCSEPQARFLFKAFLNPV